MMLEDEFLENLSEISRNLEKGNIDNFKALRSLIRSIDLYEIFKTWKSPNKKFLAYFLRLFIDDFWKNLAVDSSYELKEIDIQSICKIRGNNINQAVNHINDNDNKSYNHLSHIVEAYAQIICQAEDELRGENQ